jgi:3-oxoacyl-[acyl-carrier protein] reductase
MAELEALAAANGCKLLWVGASVAVEEDAERAVSECEKALGGVDILVNNAGITKDGLIFRMKAEDWKAVLDVNLTGAFYFSRACASKMIKQRSGSIINMGSIVGITGNGGQCNYSASKAGLVGLTKSLAKEVASRGVRVNLIAPGFIDTDMTQALKDEQREALLKQIPLGRIAGPEAIADASLFLASDLSSYITGQVLRVDGGMGM